MPSFVIRPFRTGDEAPLRAVFHASVHGLACRHYSAEQLAAWAPLVHDSAQWAERLRAGACSPYFCQCEGHPRHANQGA